MRFLAFELVLRERKGVEGGHKYRQQHSVRKDLLVEGECSCDVGAALPKNPTQVKGCDILSEAPLPASFLQEIPGPQKALQNICRDILGCFQ